MNFNIKLLTISFAMLSLAHADAGGAGFDPMQFAPIVLIFVVFYFLIMRPQQKKAKKHQDLLSNLQRGDKVVTNGGLIGTISKVISDSELEIEVADDVRVRVIRSMVSDLFAKPEPVNVVKNKTADEKKPVKKAITRSTTTAKKTTTKKIAANKK